MSDMKEVVLSASGLTKRFGAFLAVNNVNLELRKNEIHGLIGPNGAGKTTLFNLLTKFVIPTAGKVNFLGDDITNLSPAVVARRGLVRSFQISAVFSEMSLLDNVRVALQRRAGLATQFWRSECQLARLNSQAMNYLDCVGLADRAFHKASELSYGRKRALEMAATLALEPKVLLLDEPMAGMGHEDIKLVSELVHSAAASRAVLMVEHNLEVVAELCHRATVMQRGEVLVSGGYREVAADERVRTAYMGSDDE
jgi:branched-chain amino acid transport system ATP-binding protein